MAKPAPNESQARIGRAVRARRVALGRSLGAVAADLGVAMSTLSKLENGLLPITFERLESLSRLLDVNIGSLLGQPSSADPDAPPREAYGTRRSVTRGKAATAVEGGVYTLAFHATDLLDKRFQPLVAEIHTTDIKDYGPYTRHDGEEFNFVISGRLEFHTDIYAPVILEVGDSIYFDAEMGHAHIRLGEEPCTLVAMLVPRTARTAENGVAAVLEVQRAGATDREHVRL
jgi:transcriptional regulator with XRE-family HTH domain